MNLQSFLQKSLLKGDIPSKLVGCYICFREDGTIQIREPTEVVIPSCPKCNGTGSYRHYGTCFDCKAKGHLTFGDQMRDSYYHQLRRQSDDVKP
jgi:DnaJ-class molecular chaperone